MSEPEIRYSPAALRKADRQLANLADVCLEEDGDVPAWIIAARHAVMQAREENSHE